MLSDVYKLFGIGAHEKKKKVRLLDKIWATYESADVSAKAMSLLFPELESGLDITQVRPSKKGFARLQAYKAVPLMEPLGKSFAHMP